MKLSAFNKVNIDNNLESLFFLCLSGEIPPPHPQPHKKAGSKLKEAIYYQQISNWFYEINRQRFNAEIEVPSAVNPELSKVLAVMSELNMSEYGL